MGNYGSSNNFSFIVEPEFTGYFMQQLARYIYFYQIER